MCLQNLIFTSGLCVSFIFGSGGAQAQSAGGQQNSGALGSAQDCTEVQVGYSDDPELTNEEKLALMDRALFKSLSMFDTCQTTSSGGGSSGAGGSSGSSNEGNGAKSVASSGMSGTEAPADSPQASSADEFVDEETELLSNEEGISGQENSVLDNGKVPEDIPLADNDSILEAQIRQAAMNEKDPETQKKLWDEYRRYKGLPITK